MEALVRLVAGRPRTILLVTAALLLLSAWRIAKLRLDTDFAQLLPRSAPAVVALAELDRRMSALSSLDVVVEGPDAAANRRYVDALVPRLRALGDPLVDEVRAGVHEEQAFFEHNKLLYAGRAQLERARDRLEREIETHKNPLFVALDDDDDDEADDAQEASPFARFVDGYFAYRDGSLYTVLIWLRSPILGAPNAAATVTRIRETARALARELASPGQRVGVTGNLITADEERAALTGDLTLATTISVVLVCIVVLLYFGRLRALPFMVLPALVGVALALALAQLLFGALNTATGFLGAIILGNGINYAIVQMARYEEERRRGAAVAEALRVALVATWRGTALAALAAAVAYGSLAFTDFRGFNQFGYIGAAGMVLAWLATLLVLPPMWVLFDRRRPAETMPRLRGFAAAAPLARLTVAHPRCVLLAGIAVTLLAVPPLVRFARDPFEYDFDKLRNQAAKRSDAERLSARLDPIFGRSLSPSFVLVDDPAQVDEIRRKLRERDRTRHVLGAIKTVADYLPGSAAEQTRKLGVLAEIRRLVDDNIDFVDEDERPRFAELRPSDDLRVLGPGDLPRSVRRLYTEADGTIGRAAAWFPREDLDIWDGRVLRRIAATVEDLRLDDGSRVYSSGRPVIFAAMLDAVIHDGPIVATVSFAAVLLLVLVLARGRGAWLIVGSLCIGVEWMLGAVAVAGVRINFLNFIALPITFGIAADYSANLYLRYRQEGRARLQQVVASTGGAVALCSLTTIIGYGSLLAADTQGLRTFGAAAILGELACLTTALVLMPALLAIVDRRST
ncbi:MAG: putative rane protein [bacterium]|nr:putative rane protein [bacterium]